MTPTSDTLVTVAIPTFNRAHFLERAARSVLDQTHTNLELWIYDNASEDDTPAVCAGLVDDPRVRIVRHESNIGFVPNQNVAYGGGAGAYVLVIGDDDILRPDSLASTVPHSPTTPITPPGTRNGNTFSIPFSRTIPPGAPSPINLQLTTPMRVPLLTGTTSSVTDIKFQ